MDLNGPVNNKRNKNKRDCRAWLCLFPLTRAHGRTRSREGQSGGGREHRRRFAKSWLQRIQRVKKTVPVDEAATSVADPGRSDPEVVTRTMSRRGGRRRKLRILRKILPMRCKGLRGKALLSILISRERNGARGGDRRAEEMETSRELTFSSSQPRVSTATFQNALLVPSRTSAAEAEDSDEVDGEQWTSTTPVSSLIVATPPTASPAYYWNRISDCSANCMSPLGLTSDGNYLLVGMSTLAIVLLALLAGGRSLAIVCASAWFYVLPTLRARMGN